MSHIFSLVQSQGQRICRILYDTCRNYPNAEGRKIWTLPHVLRSLHGACEHFACLVHGSLSPWLASPWLSSPWLAQSMGGSRPMQRYSIDPVQWRVWANATIRRCIGPVQWRVWANGTLLYWPSPSMTMSEPMPRSY